MAEKEKCEVVFRVPVHPSIVIGGASLGRCQNDAAPGLTCCWEHANKETLIHYIRMLLKEIDELKKKKKKK